MRVREQLHELGIQRSCATTTSLVAVVAPAAVLLIVVVAAIGATTTTSKYQILCRHATGSFRILTCILKNCAKKICTPTMRLGLG